MRSLRYLKRQPPPRTRLLFYKLPDADWTRADSAVVREFLAGRGYAFLDLNEYHEQIALDPAADFVDAQHLNRSGAAKVTDFLASYLASGGYLAEFSD